MDRAAARLGGGLRLKIIIIINKTKCGENPMGEEAIDLGTGRHSMGVRSGQTSSSPYVTDPLPTSNKSPTFFVLQFPYENSNSSIPA